MYANSLLATLNTRQVLKGRGTDNAHQTIPTFIMYPPDCTSNDPFAAGGKVRIIMIFHVLGSSALLVVGVR